MLGIGRLMTQKIAVCARIKILPVAFAALFADGKRNGAVRVLRMDGRDDLADEIIRVKRVLAALQNERAKAEVVPLRAAGKNLLFRQTVSRHVSVIPTDATIVTVIFAVIRKLNESAHVHVRAVVRAAHLVRGLLQRRVIGIGLQNRLKFRIAEVTLLAQTVDQSVNFICGHEIPPFFKFGVAHSACGFSSVRIARIVSEMRSSSVQPSISAPR